MATELVGITFIVPENQDAIGVYEAEGGVEVFETDEPYLLSDGKSLVDPMPVRMVGGPIYQDTLGNSQAALAITLASSWWSPADLFANGEQGSFWGTLPYYSDAAGTVEADWGDPVGFIPDASGNGNDWTQVTSTARPILGRVPVGGRRNIATRTEEEISSSRGWASANFIDSIDIHGKRYLRYLSPGAGVTLTGFSAAPVEDGEYVISWFWVPGSPTSQITISRSAAVFVNPVTGFIRGDGTKHLSVGDDLVDVEMLATGELRISIKTLVQGGSGGQNYRWNIFTPTADEVVLLTGGMIVVGDTNYPYQRVGNAYDITEAGVKGIHYLRFDGTDDSEPTTLPAISGGTIVLAGTDGIWIDEIDFAGGEFSVGPDTYTGGPAGLMSILGDILARGCFVIDRALTTEEIAQVEGYYKARGAGDLIEGMP